MFFGKIVGGIADVSENWMISIPFYISAEFYLNNSFSFCATLSTNKYSEGKVYQNGYVIDGDANYFSTDLAAKFSFRDIMRSYKFDPYVFIGIGYQNIGEFSTIKKEYPYDIRIHESFNGMSANMGLGFNYWFSQTWGMNVNLMAKWGLSESTFTTDGNVSSIYNNHKQYNIGVLYFLN